MPEKEMPRDMDAERAILGVCLLDNIQFDVASERLRTADFSASHGEIFDAMLELHSRKAEINPLTLCDELHRVGRLETVGGRAYVGQLIDGRSAFSSIDSSIDIVAKKSKARRLIRLGQKIVNTGLDGEMPIDEQLAQAESGLIDISASAGSASWQPIRGATRSYLEKVKARKESGRMISDFSTGFSDLDYFTLGLERRTMSIIAARPSMGKTALGLSMTKNMSESRWNIVEGMPPVVAWFSMEMPSDQLANRFLASVAGVEARRLHLGQLTKDEEYKILEAEEQIGQWRVEIDDRVGLTIRQMRDALRVLRRDHGGVDVVFVDYLQLGDGDRQKGDSRETEVANISKGLMGIAKDFDVSVVALSQLNRALESKADKRPNLNDLRESGQIEQDAYLVMGLYRDKVYNPHTDEPNIAELIILKQRNGPLGTVRLFFHDQRIQFGDLAREGFNYGR